jgi:hypothetical protein
MKTARTEIKVSQQPWPADNLDRLLGLLDKARAEDTALAARIEPRWPYRALLAVIDEQEPPALTVLHPRPQAA